MAAATNKNRGRKDKRKTLKKRKTIQKRKLTKKRKTIRKRRPMRGGEEEDCPICLEEMNNPDKNITLSCNHKFHKKCMSDTCRSTASKNKCLCPLCRKQLSPEEMKTLGFEPIATETMSNTIFNNLNELPYLFSMEEFKVYINQKLRAPTRFPLDKLERELKMFLGTDRLPLEIYDEIMEFNLEQISNLYRYRFTGIVRNVPTNKLQKKYFKFLQMDDEDREHYRQEYGDEDEDEVDIYAYQLVEL